ncbi:hypothetical protein [Streptomyces javensis]|uniref:Uncharacterized protein n=1 Tax=Streptomyces javensis TaxID=114698 RepID=A0ABS0R6R0_9ACTN|nr:hypothetical protein [Streptomyces javensis]MBI0313038.1 hypothetical protein [Streptomyces javensis]
MKATAHAECITWQQIDGTWSIGFYDLEADEPTEHFYFASRGHQSLEAVRDEYEGGIPEGALKVHPYGTLSTENRALLNAMAAHCLSGPRPKGV